jgi:hypothetical protein
MTVVRAHETKARGDGCARHRGQRARDHRRARQGFQGTLRRLPLGTAEVPAGPPAVRRLPGRSARRRDLPRFRLLDHSPRRPALRRPRCGVESGGPDPRLRIRCTDDAIVLKTSPPYAGRARVEDVAFSTFQVETRLEPRGTDRHRERPAPPRRFARPGGGESREPRRGARAGARRRSGDRRLFGPRIPDGSVERSDHGTDADDPHG